MQQLLTNHREIRPRRRHIMCKTEHITPKIPQERKPQPEYTTAAVLTSISKSERTLLRKNLKNLLEIQERQSARQLREAEDLEHKRIIRFSDEVNARVASASMLATKELSSIDREVRLTHNLL